MSFAVVVRAGPILECFRKRFAITSNFGSAVVCLDKYSGIVDASAG